MALLADGQRQLVIRHHHAAGLLALGHEHAQHVRGIQGVCHKLGGIGAPLDDVDLLALQLLHHAIHAAAALSNASAHGVDHHIGGMHGHLGAAARLTGNGLDGHDAAGDLGHLHLKQALDQIGMDAADAHLRAAGTHGGGALHLQHVHLDVVVVMQHLAGNHVALLQNALGAAQIDVHALGLHALHDSGEHFAFLFDVLIVDLAALRLADALHDDLLGGLRRHAQESVGGHVHLGNVAHLIVAAQLACVLQTDLAALLLHLGDDELAGIHMGHARLPVHHHRQIGGSHLQLIQVLLISRLQRLLDGAEQQLLADVLFLCERLQGLDDRTLAVFLFRLLYRSHVATAFRLSLCGTPSDKSTRLTLSILTRTDRRSQCLPYPPRASPWPPPFSGRTAARSAYPAECCFPHPAPPEYR